MTVAVLLQPVSALHQLCTIRCVTTLLEAHRVHRGRCRVQVGHTQTVRRRPESHIGQRPRQMDAGTHTLAWVFRDAPAQLKLTHHHPGHGCSPASLCFLSRQEALLSPLGRPCRASQRQPQASLIFQHSPIPVTCAAEATTISSLGH